MFIASGIGGFSTIESEHEQLLSGGPRRISPFFIPASIINLAAGQVSIRHRRPRAESGHVHGLHGLGAFDRRSRTRSSGAAMPTVMIAGGSEASITPMGVGGFARIRALSTRNDEPGRASRPFDKDRDGFVVGEGAGILILEELEFAKAPRRADLRRDRRLRPVGRRVPPDIAARRRQRRGAIDADGAAQGAASSRRKSTTSTRTARRRRSTTRPRRWPSRRRSANTPTSW